MLFRRYLDFLFATLFFVGIFFGFFSLGTVYASFVQEFAPEAVTVLVLLTFDIAALLLVLPTVFGYGRLCINLARGNDTSLSSLFDGYGSKENLLEIYSFFLRGIPSVFLKLVLPVLFVSYIREALEFMTQKLAGSPALSYLRTVSALFIVPCVLILLLSYYLLGKSVYSFFAFCGNDFCIGEKVQYNKTAFFKLRASFIPLTVISCFTFGLMFVAYTLPIIFISYSLFFGYDESGEFEDEEEYGEEICDDTSVTTAVFEAVDNINFDNNSEIT